MVVVRTDNQWFVQASFREYCVPVNVDILQLTDLHQIYPLPGNVVFDPPLELLIILDFLNRIALGARVDGNHTTEFLRLLGALLDGNVNFLVATLVANRRCCEPQATLKCRPDVVEVTVFREDTDVIYGLAAMIVP